MENVLFQGVSEKRAHIRAVFYANANLQGISIFEMRKQQIITFCTPSLQISQIASVFTNKVFRTLKFPMF